MFYCGSINNHLVFCLDFLFVLVAAIWHKKVLTPKQKDVPLILSSNY
jgi:hypothetical protein